MEKSIHTAEYAVCLRLVRAARRQAGLTQAELARRLHTSQSFVTKVETGDRRLDVIQLRTLCRICGTTLTQFVTELEQVLAKPSRGASRSRSERG